MGDTHTLFAAQGATLCSELLSAFAAQGAALGALLFSPNGDAASALADTGFPCACVPLQRLDGSDPVGELWRPSGDAIPIRGQHGAIAYCHDGETVFGALSLAETPVGADKTPLQQATETAYRQVFSLLDTLGYAHLFRFWNYMAAINTSSHGSERYRQFNRGRHDAFQAHARNSAENAPAACALGCAAGPLSVAFLAGRVPPLRIENPRQTSAYRYPQQYGPRSPTFSRATLARLGTDEVLLLSGTASVVGHATLHVDDVLAQTRETIANIGAVVDEANRLARGPGFALSDLHYRVYIRHANDLPVVRGEVERQIGGAAKAVYLKADVCRADLLVEIEASAAHQAAPNTAAGKQ